MKLELNQRSTHAVPVILNAKMDQFLVLNVVAGTTPVNVPAMLQMSLDVCKKLQDLFGCVKTAKNGKKLL